jgi:hypothetical protein
MKAVLLLLVGVLLALAGFFAGFKYHETKSDEIRGALAGGAISGLRSQSALSLSCDSGRLRCDETTRFVLMNDYARRLFDVWAYYLISHDVEAEDALCASIKIVKATASPSVELQRTISNRFGCTYQPPRSVAKVVPRPGSAPDQPPASVEEIRERIERRRAAMQADSESSQGSQ